MTDWNKQDKLLQDAEAEIVELKHERELLEQRVIDLESMLLEKNPPSLDDWDDFEPGVV